MNFEEKMTEMHGSRSVMVKCIEKGYKMIEILKLYCKNEIYFIEIKMLKNVQIRNWNCGP